MELAPYKIKTNNFEGPLEVLLNLIEKRKLFINEISLASITDDYIAYVTGISDRNIGDYASFIAVAATLILIKSRSLIPNLSLTAEEESDVSSLERRLELYKLIKEIGVEVAEKFGKNIIFPRLENRIEMKVFVPDTQITKESMFLNLSDVIKALPVEEAPKPEVLVMKIRSLDEVIQDMSERMQTAMKMTFRDFSRSGSSKSVKEEKVNVIVSFLAMLELVRQGIIHANQGADFEDIDLEKIS